VNNSAGSGGNSPIKDNNNINGVGNVIQYGENSEENNPSRKQLRKRIIPKTQKVKLNTTVYKIFEDKIHQGYICEFDPKDGFYKIKYQDGDIEEGTEEEISQLLLRNRTKQHGNRHYQLPHLRERMPSTVKQRRECRYDHIFLTDTEKQSQY
jgi:hypothetical protein